MQLSTSPSRNPTPDLKLAIRLRYVLLLIGSTYNVQIDPTTMQPTENRTLWQNWIMWAMLTLF